MGDGEAKQLWARVLIVSPCRPSTVFLLVGCSWLSWLQFSWSPKGKLHEEINPPFFNCFTFASIPGKWQTAHAVHPHALVRAHWKPTPAQRRWEVTTSADRPAGIVNISGSDSSEDLWGRLSISEWSKGATVHFCTEICCNALRSSN